MGSVNANGRQNRAEDRHFEHRWNARKLQLSQARTLVRGWLRSNRISGIESALLLAVTELLSNAREASQPADPIILRLELDDDDVALEVENKGRDFEPSFDLPDALAPRGRGLGLVSAVADAVNVEHDRGRTRVVARFGL